MAGWIDLFRDSLKDEFLKRPMVASLATVDELGWPRCRSVILRRLDSDGSIWFTSDARSEKNQHIKKHEQAESCFWLPTLRRQFRLSGTAAILGQSNDVSSVHRCQIWRELSPASQQLFFAPAAGSPIAGNRNRETSEHASQTLPPPTFELIVIRPITADYLDLTSDPHQRMKWTKNQEPRHPTDWIQTPINP